MLKKLIKKFSSGGASDGIYVSYPSLKISIGKGKYDNVGGHGMVIAVDENTGQTRGSEYGRYKSKHGSAHQVRVPDFHPADPGNPTEEELNAYAQQLANNTGLKAVNVTYVKGPDYQEMVDYMKETEQGEGYAEDPYNVYSHNCGTYGCEVINLAMPFHRQVSGRLLNFQPAVFNTIMGGLVGAGHAIELNKPGLIWDGLTSAGGAGGRADAHGWSLPWTTTRGKYRRK